MLTMYNAHPYFFSRKFGLKVPLYTAKYGSSMTPGRLRNLTEPQLTHL